MVENKKVRFKDLSFWLKAGIIAAWIYGGYAIVAFILGFIEGLTGVPAA